TTTSIAPSSLSTLATAAAAASACFRSAATVSTRPFGAASFATAASRLLCARETSATLAPSSRNARAHDNPMPLLPPVINTTLSASPSSTIPPAEITEIDYSSLRQFKGDRDAGEHPDFDPDVVEEGTETVRRSTMPDEPQLIEDHANSRGKSDVVRPGEPQVKANSYHHRDEGPMK